MAVEWKGSEGKSLQAVIDSQYTSNHNDELPGLHWRHATFETEHPNETTYIQSEKITVMNNLDFGRPKNMLKIAGTGNVYARAIEPHIVRYWQNEGP